MPSLATPRHFLPELAVSQSQKEITHNEALILIDALLHPVIEGFVSTPPTLAADQSVGKCWGVGTSPTADWTGQAGKIACWAGGSWRFLQAVEGMSVYNLADDARYHYIGSQWLAPQIVADPSGGSVIDIEARQILTSLLSVMRSHGQIAT